MMKADDVKRALEQSLGELKVTLADRMLTKLRERTPKRTGYTASRWELTDAGVSNDQGDTIMRLNDGSSRQAAAGFIEQSIDETVVEVEREVKR